MAAAFTTCLDVSKVHCERDGFALTKPVSFTVHPGELVWLEGANGTGKTTLIRQLLGIRDTPSGSIRWFDTPLAELTSIQRHRIAFIGHRLALKRDLSCLENLQAALHQTDDDTTAISETLKRVQLLGYEDALVRELSAGQQKRLCIARTMLSPAIAWVLDEPYANLDRAGVALVHSLLRDHMAQGGCAIITSHGLYDMDLSNARPLRLEVA